MNATHDPNRSRRRDFVVAARALGAGAMSLPCAYAGAHVLSLAFAAVAMSRRGVTLGLRDLSLLAAALIGLASLAFVFTG